MLNYDGIQEKWGYRLGDCVVFWHCGVRKRGVIERFTSGKVLIRINKHQGIYVSHHQVERKQK